MKETYKHIELRNAHAKVIKKFPNTKDGRMTASIHARRIRRKGGHAFVYRVTETLID